MCPDKCPAPANTLMILRTHPHLRNERRSCTVRGPLCVQLPGAGALHGRMGKTPVNPGMEQDEHTFCRHAFIYGIHPGIVDKKIW